MRKAIAILGVCLALLTASLGCGENTDKIDAEVGVSATVALAEGHIESMVNAMEVLAMTDEVKSGDWEQMVDLLAH